MKLIKTLFCASALLCAGLPASAAWPTGATFTPANEDIPADQTITVTFLNDKDDVSIPLNIMGYMVGGIGFGQDPTPLFLTADTRDADNNVVLQFDLEESYWGYPNDGKYGLYIALVVVDEYGDPVDGPDGEMLAFEKTYSRPVEGASKCLLQFPNEVNWEQEGLTFNQFYEYGYATLYFSKPIAQPEGPIGKITYNLYTGEHKEADITSYEYSVDVDPLSGMWTLSFNVIKEGLEASEISSMIIDFNKFKSVDGDKEVDVDVEPMTIVNNSPATPMQKAVKKQKESGIPLDVSADEVTVYNLQGMVVLENATASSINNLPAGVYIINGKKVAIR